jgi:hypothetical protein
VDKLPVKKIGGKLPDVEEETNEEEMTEEQLTHYLRQGLLKLEGFAEGVNSVWLTKWIYSMRSTINQRERNRKSTQK